MYNMFSGCTNFNQNLSSWNVSSVTDMTAMFADCTSFDQDLSSWDISSVTTMADMFHGCTLSTANYDSLLIGWAAQSVQSGVTFSGGNSTYSAAPSDAATARDHLVTVHGWSITDGGSI
jgi:surface protein